MLSWGGSYHAPLLDETRTVEVEPVSGDNPLCFEASGLKSVSEVRYWAPGGALRDEADGVISGADLGRVDVGRRTHALYGPVDGWPSALSGSLFVVEYVRGIQDADLPAARQAVVAFVRFNYDGFREAKPRESFIQQARSLRL